MSKSEGRVPNVNPLQEKTAFRRALERLPHLRPVTWFVIHIGTYVDPILMRLSGGRVNSTNADTLLILHHVGARTGKARQGNLPR